MFFALLIFSILPHLFVSADSNDELKAAFIKNDDLWIKIDNKEKELPMVNM